MDSVDRVLPQLEHSLCLLPVVVQVASSSIIHSVEGCVQSGVVSSELPPELLVLPPLPLAVMLHAVNKHTHKQMTIADVNNLCFFIIPFSLCFCDLCRRLHFITRILYGN